MQVIDPVCKMVIEDKDAVGTSVYKGTTYYFCSGMCKEDFDKDPETFLKPVEEEVQKQSQGKWQRILYAEWLSPRTVQLRG